MSDCTGGESNAVVRKRNGKRRFRRVRGVKSANIRRIQKPNLHFGLRDRKSTRLNSSHP